MQYKQIYAEINYSAATQSYYGELLDIGKVVCFQASNKNEALEIMRQMIEQHLTATQEA